MKKQIFATVFVLAVAWIRPGAFAQDQAPAPSFKEGDTWQFNITRKGQVATSSEQVLGDYELTYSQGKFKLYEVVGGQKTELNISPDSTTASFLALVGQREGRQLLKFPLLVGQKWKDEYKTQPAGAKQEQNRSVEVSVAGLEKVATAAGSFNAFKIVRTESWLRAGRQGGWATTTMTYFYSPEVRSIVKRSSSSDSSPATVELELKKFVPGN